MVNRIFGEASTTVDGNVWTLRCDFNALCEVEAATGEPALDLFRRMEAGAVRFDVLRQIARAFLGRHHPGVTLEQAGDVLGADMGILEAVLTAAVPSAPEDRVPGNRAARRSRST